MRLHGVRELDQPCKTGPTSALDEAAPSTAKPRRRAVTFLVSLAMTILGIGCLQDFDTFESNGGADSGSTSLGSEAGASDAAPDRSTPTDGAASCTSAPATCLTQETQCQNTCASTRTTCEKNCGTGPGTNSCRQRCKSDEPQCRDGCSATCRSCAGACTTGC